METFYVKSVVIADLLPCASTVATILFLLSPMFLKVIVFVAAPETFPAAAATINRKACFKVNDVSTPFDKSKIAVAIVSYSPVLNATFPDESESVVYATVSILETGTCTSAVVLAYSKLTSPSTHGVADKVMVQCPSAWCVMAFAVSDTCQVPSEFLHHFPAFAPEMFFKYQFTVPDVTPEPLVLSIIVKHLCDV